MYRIVRENNDITLIAEGEEITGFCLSGYDDDKTEYNFFTNTEDNVTSITFQQIGVLKIEKIPDKTVFHIYMSTFDKDISDDLLNNIPYPLNVVEFIKKNKKNLIKFTNNVWPETWKSKWTIESYFTELINIAKQYSSIVIHEDDKYPINEERFSLTFEYMKTGTIQETYSECTTIIHEIIEKTESSLDGLILLQKAIKTWNENRNNSLEEFWQNALIENSWVIAQCFSTPLILYHDKAYIGGKTIDNRNGNIIDFTYKNRLTNNITLIEIKTPIASLVGDEYRGVYSISKELSGSINQLLHYKDKCQKDFYSLSYGSDGFEIFNPKCLLIIGTLMNLDKERPAN